MLFQMLLTIYAKLVEKSGLVECLNRSKISQVGSGTALVSVSNNVSRAKLMLQVRFRDVTTDVLPLCISKLHACSNVYSVVVTFEKLSASVKPHRSLSDKVV